MSYPLLIEPRSTLLHQAWGWSVAYGLFVLLCAGTTLYVSRNWAMSAAPAQAAQPTAGTAPKPRAADHLLWLALPADGIAQAQESMPPQLGTRPFYLVDKMKDGPLKTTLKQCTGPFRKTDFSIGHRGAPLQFPEHTKESYEAGRRMGRASSNAT